MFSICDRRSRSVKCTLTYNDIDLEKRTISINKSYQRLDGRDIITPPKTPKSKRIVTIWKTDDAASLTISVTFSRTGKAGTKRNYSIKMKLGELPCSMRFSGMWS